MPRNGGPLAPVVANRPNRVAIMKITTVTPGDQLERTIIRMAEQSLRDLLDTEKVSNANRWKRVEAYGRVSAYAALGKDAHSGLSANAVATLERIEERANRSFRKKKLMVYHNPHTDETIRTRGSNHKTLQKWKTLYGDAAVYSWRLREED